MLRFCIAALGRVGLMAPAASAQDAKAVIGAAAKAMGVETLTSIHYYGVAQNGSLGQNNNANQPWPMANANDYMRAIDFSQPASRATWVTFAVPVQGGPAVQGQGQQNITPQNNAWAQQLEIWTTPWGFLKGAAAASSAVSRTETIAGRRFHVVEWQPSIKSPGGQPYRVVGYINDQNLVERVNTWLEHSVFGDMLVESEYTHYRELNGLRFPAQMVQKRGGWPVFQAYVLGARPNPADIQQLTTVPPPAAGRAGGPGAAGTPASGGPSPTSEKLAEGVFRITGAYNALAVEFADHVVLFEPGPQNEARGLAIIAETRRVIPNKPIRYGVISHHHFDHTGGINAAVGEDITIVTPAVNRAFLERALGGPRTLAPDSLSKSGRKLKIEGFTGDLRVFEDKTRRFEIHVIKGLPHADGLVVGFLPKERLLVYADMFNLPAASNPVPNPPVVGTMVFLENIERLKLDVDRILSVHTLNPDRLASVADLRASLGR
jgi:glyoxylase-like metal-dependent hydrolase (beta-lactamase superfamily II)